MEKIPDIIHPSWHEYLQPLFDDKKMLLIKNQVLPRCKFYPESDKIFRVFNMPVQDIKVVILGQDPYFNGSANGFAFAVNQQTMLPKSLQIIKNEIINSQVERDTYVNIESAKWRTLSHWNQQKIFLLNTALTVEVGIAGSHTGQWQWFTREVIKVISKVSRPVWLLWGSKAKSYKDYILHGVVVKNSESAIDQYRSAIITDKSNPILEADHPAAESYPNSKFKFSGCNHFNLCNHILKLRDKTIINW